MSEGRGERAGPGEILEREAQRPPAREVFDRIRGRTPVPTRRPIAELIREERAERDDR